MINHIRKLRAAHGWSQSHLAGQLKVSRQTINAIESGRQEPRLSLAFAVSRLFNKPIEHIFIPDQEQA